MLLPVPFFWTLYDQQPTVWMVQALQMDSRLWGGVTMLPDQMQTLNTVFILVYIPIFQVIIYPLASRVVTLTPLRKIVTGGLLASLAFVISGFVQRQINPTLPPFVPPERALVSFINGFEHCDLTATWNGVSRAVPANASLEIDDLFDVPSGPNTWQLAYKGAGCETDRDLPPSVTYDLDGGAIHYVFVGEMGAFVGKADASKPTGGNGEFSLGINLALSDVDYSGHLALCRSPADGTPGNYPCDPRKPDDFFAYENDPACGSDYEDMIGQRNYTTSSGASSAGHEATLYKFKSIRPGRWDLYYLHNTAKCVGRASLSAQEVNVTSTGVAIEVYAPGGIYLMALSGNSSRPQKHIFQVASENVVSILWQIPQILVLTAGEILFSITGYEFAYSQTAPSLKALVQALWLFTIAVGDTLIIIITSMRLFENMATQAFVYAGIMALVMLILALLSIFYYEYHYYTGADADGDNGLDVNDNDAVEEPRGKGCDIPMGNMAPDCSRDGHVDKGFGAFTYCCSTDYCNSSMQKSLPATLIFMMTLLVLAMTRQ
ncbi:low-affinity peptide transporter [Aphelenchoides avenae]|nr:low-affinity peptide transporter [Aphelenchus avenae]